jgi:4-alpha-glucanotransferase
LAEPPEGGKQATAAVDGSGFIGLLASSELPAAAPSRIVLATPDDALSIEERPNLPAAGPGWPNWALALPVPIDDFESRPLPARVARALQPRDPAPG